MLTKEDLLAISELMDTKLKPIEDRLTGVEDHLTGVEDHLAGVEDRLTAVEEDTRVTRAAVNSLLEWADDASIQVIPLFKKKAK